MLRNLRHFAAVADTLNFRNAATVAVAESAAAVSAAGLIIAAAEQLYPQLDLYR